MQSSVCARVCSAHSLAKQNKRKAINLWAAAIFSTASQQQVLLFLPTQAERNLSVCFCVRGCGAFQNKLRLGQSQEVMIPSLAGRRFSTCAPPGGALAQRACDPVFSSQRPACHSHWSSSRPVRVCVSPEIIFYLE